MNNVILVIVFIFVVSFGLIIFLSFSKNCASGFVFDSNVNACRLYCPAGQIYDYDKQQCHPDCGGSGCSCTDGEIWDPKAGDCVPGCKSDSDCGSGSICKNGECVPICGNTTCDDGQTCVKVSGISAATKANIKDNDKNVYFDPKDPNTAYFCINPSSGCVFDPEVSIPGVVGDNYYPCFNITSSGFCGSKSASDVDAAKICYDKYKDQSSCTADECQWYDLLSSVSDPTTLADANVQIQNISGTNGYYCNYGDDTKPYSRVVGKMTKNCNVQDCVSNMALPGVTDIYFDQDKNTCVGFQGCDLAPTMQNQQLVYNPKTRQVEEIPNTNPMFNNFSTTFSDCTSNDAITTCNQIQKNTPYSCNPKESGKLSTINKCSNRGNWDSTKTTDCMGDTTVDGACICTSSVIYGNAAGTSCQYTSRDTCSNRGDPNCDGSCTWT